MNWLLHNAVADLYGPYFLVFYAIAIGVVVVVCYKSVRDVDKTGDMDLPTVSAKIDPYEIAYLRGAENEVARVAIASLIQRGVLQITEEKQRLATIKKIALAREPVAGEVTGIEARILGWRGFPAAPADLFKLGGLASMIWDEYASGYESDLNEQHFLAPSEMPECGVRLWWIGSAMILGLGGYKLAVALANGHSNVVFLCLIGIVGLVALLSYV